MFNHKEYNRNWSRNNKDKRRISRKKWRDKNLEYLKIYNLSLRETINYKFVKYKTRAKSNNMEFSIPRERFNSNIFAI